jgi:hypothetical protein
MTRATHPNRSDHVLSDFVAAPGLPIAPFKRDWSEAGPLQQGQKPSFLAGDCLLWDVRICGEAGAQAGSPYQTVQ